MRSRAVVVIVVGLSLVLTSCAASLSSPTLEESCAQLDREVSKWKIAAEQGTTVTSITALRAAQRAAAEYIPDIAAVEISDDELRGLRDELVNALLDWHETFATTTDESKLISANGAIAGPSVDIDAICFTD